MTQKENEDKIANMEEKLNKLEHELQARYSDMGKGFLEFASCEQKEVNRLVDDIIETRKKLAQIKNEIRCDECLIFNSPDSKYCRRCGSKLNRPLA